MAISFFNFATETEGKVPPREPAFGFQATGIARRSSSDLASYDRNQNHEISHTMVTVDHINDNFFHLTLENKVACTLKGLPQQVLLAQWPITLVLMMINSCSYSTNNIVFN